MLIIPYLDIEKWIEVLLNSSNLSKSAFPFILKAVLEKLPERLTENAIQSMEAAERLIQEFKIFQKISDWSGKVIADCLISSHVKVEVELNSLSFISQYILKSILQEQIELSMKDKSWTLPIYPNHWKELKPIFREKLKNGLILEEVLPIHPFYGPLYAKSNEQLLKEILSQILPVEKTSNSKKRL